MQTIRNEAKVLSGLDSNLDNLREKFTDIDRTKDLSVTCPAFDIMVYNENLFILLANSKYHKFKQEWDKRPDYVSYEFFNVTLYWPLILFINFCDNIQEFTNFDEILIPNMTTIINLIRDRKKLTRSPFVLEYELIERRDRSNHKKYIQHPLNEYELEQINLRYIKDETESILKKLEFHHNLNKEDDLTF